MMVRYLSPRQIEAAKGRPVEFTVIRDGVLEQRTGQLGRVTQSCVWVGPWVYHRSEVMDTLRLPGGIPAEEDR
jgi:hypothetical protein